MFSGPCCFNKKKKKKKSYNRAGFRMISEGGGGGGSIWFSYCSYCTYSKRQAWAISVDPDQTPQNAAFDQGLHCLLLTQQFYKNNQLVKWICWREVYDKELVVRIFRVNTVSQIYQMYPKFPIIWVQRKVWLNPTNPLWIRPCYNVDHCQLEEFCMYIICKQYYINWKITTLSVQEQNIQFM